MKCFAPNTQYWQQESLDVENFDKTRYCGKEASCCNYLQDYQTSQDVAKWLPKACHEKYDEFIRDIQDLMCFPCSFGETDPDYATVTRDPTTQAVTAVTLYVCDYYAAQIYAPMKDPNKSNLLTSPPEDFDQCGFNLYSSSTAFT